MKPIILESKIEKCILRKMDGHLQIVYIDSYGTVNLIKKFDQVKLYVRRLKHSGVSNKLQADSYAYTFNYRLIHETYNLDDIFCIKQKEYSEIEILKYLFELSNQQDNHYLRITKAKFWLSPQIITEIHERKRVFKTDSEMKHHIQEFPLTDVSSILGLHYLQAQDDHDVYCYNKEYLSSILRLAYDSYSLKVKHMLIFGGIIVLGYLLYFFGIYQLLQNYDKGILLSSVSKSALFRIYVLVWSIVSFNYFLFLALKRLYFQYYFLYEKRLLYYIFFGLNIICFVLYLLIFYLIDMNISLMTVLFQSMFLIWNVIFFSKNIVTVQFLNFVDNNALVEYLDTQNKYKYGFVYFNFLISPMFLLFSIIVR